WTFQIGVLALSDIKNLRLEFSDFGGLSASDFHCINMGGKDWLGREFTKEINVKKDRVQALWVYVQIPENAEKEYKGTVYVKADNCETREAKLNISVRGEVLDDKGFSDLWRMSRLAWLDSDMAIDDTVVPPYTPIEVSDNKAKILNREIIFSDTGFPLSIKSYGREILSESVSFRVGEESVEKISEKVLKKNEGVFEKEYISGNDNIELRVCPKLEFEGCLNYGVTLRAKKDMSFEDVSLCVPVKKDIAEYFMGMAVRGGLAPDYAEWKWQSDNAAHMAWCGTYNAGIQLRLETKNHGYFITPPIPREEYPHGWYNNGAELFSAKKEENVFLMKAQRGKTEMKAGEELSFDVRFMITPFKPLDNKHHYRDRVGLPGQPRTNIVHIHHATGAVNPYINYPFRTVEKLKEVQNGLKAVPNDKRAGEYMKRLDPSFEGSLIGRYPIKDEWFTNEGTTDYNINIYYTCRELSNHCYEIFALRSLGDEIYSDSGIIYDAQGGTVLKDGSGGGHPWVAEHLKDDYVPGWYCWLGEDHCQAVCTRFVSRWMNYYVCGMDFLMKKTGIDGLYLDGIGYDRETSKRIARVMAKNSKNYRINYHSGNNYDYENWKSNVCSNTIEHLPFMTTLWIGEMFDYDRSSDYWFAEISGIPFGLYSEMLNYETGGNRYRGMLFSMTGRQNPSYIPMLKFWDDYNLEEWEMRGWWEENPPVKAVGSDKVLATAYLPPDKNEMIIAVASWAEKREKISLKITEEALTDCPLTAFMPPIDEFQAEKSNVDLNNIEIRPGEGVIIIVKGDKENA
ncbi:MAG: hypothetical protein KBT47_03220, partial [Armatimonadetes bacterium]|nr:hypothetical protein [Candidatus Hippobium faecium]